MMVRIRITKRAIAQIVFLLAFAPGGALNPLPPGAKASPVEGKGKYAGMILIPAGPFTMGRDTGPVSERPAHKLFLPAFYIEKNLVTAEKYAKFIRAKGPAGPNGEMYLDVADPDALVSLHNGVWMANAGSENNPAGEMSWHGALAYCKWLGKRLPSEAEWEKAARGTDGRLYPWGSQKPTHELAVIGLFRGDTLPIGQRPKGASPYGVLDMAGQVWEWTRSIPRPYPYEPRDGREKLTPEEGRVARGGNSSSGDDDITAASREFVAPWRAATGHAYLGFRCAASVELVYLPDGKSRRVAKARKIYEIVASNSVHIGESKHE